MDLSTTYLGIPLPHPLMPGASPLVDDLDTVRRLEDAGAAAVVMNSLFEEQVLHEQLAVSAFMDEPSESFAEAASYLPEPEELAFGPEEYLEKLARVRKAIKIPLIASLNGVHGGRWLDWAASMQEAGADALELNVYQIATDPAEGAATIEERTVEMVEQVKAKIRIPVAVKLSPFYTSMASLAHRLEAAGADGLVIFNRFYQADIDVEELEVERSLRLSDPSELLLRIRWLAILSSQLDISLAVTGGVHGAVEAVKAVMAGAHAVQMVSALLERGPDHLSAVREELERWLEEHGYESLAQMRGSMNLARSPDPSAFERANYIQILQSWKG